MRLFIAIPLNGEMLRAALAVQGEFSRRGARGNYTPAENMHLTLAFIGEYPEPEDVLRAMDQVPFPPVGLKLQGLGAFGDLWWLGLCRDEALESYVKRLRHALAEAGIPFDRKRFTPHITLLRRAELPPRARLDMPVPGATMRVERAVLMRSDRGRHGMIYTPIE